MSSNFSFAGHIHPSVFHASAGPIRQAEAEPRAKGALRYQCPVNDSFVLVTDDETIATLSARAHLRRRCPACGEMHLLTVADADGRPGGLCARRS
ncbi:MAG: hypothetical protein WC670_08495 [Pseudolabrys sp.]